MKELKPTDLRGPCRDADNPKDGKTSNGRFIPSWIWLVPRPPQEKGDDQTEDEFNDTMRAEWAQIRARMSQWDEELLILQEEMQRVLAFFEWKSMWWLEQGKQREGLEPLLESGVVAYAHKQAAISLRMAARCAVYWLPIMEKCGINPTWQERQSVDTIEVNRASDSDNDNDEEEDNLDRAEERSDMDEFQVDDIVDFN